MAANLPSCCSIQFLEHLLKFLINFTLFKYDRSQRTYGFLITKELIFGFQILDLKDHFSASLSFSHFSLVFALFCICIFIVNPFWVNFYCVNVYLHVKLFKIEILLSYGCYTKP